MGFNATSYRLTEQPTLAHIWDKAYADAVAGETATVLLMENEKRAKGVILNLQKYRKAWEAQSSDDLKYRYAGFTLRVEHKYVGVDGEQWAVVIYPSEVEEIEFVSKDTWDDT